MAVPGYEMQYDMVANLFLYRMRGFWTMEIIGRFVADLQAAAARIRRVPLHFDTLCDSTDFPVQSTEVSLALGKIMAGAIKMRTGRTAIAVGSKLNKMQAERTLAHPSVRIFLSMDDARAWLQTPATEQP
ncbi:MAG TPA: hypothetical protein VF592_12450 [Sphingomonas sp.]|jgi:hypothetical protein|uniref:hypothetical protein n=1 Tax=Sphingomonas sp. TaxID=28214 RepID=UPI002ED9FDC9